MAGVKANHAPPGILIPNSFSVGGVLSRLTTIAPFPRAEFWMREPQCRSSILFRGPKRAGIFNYLAVAARQTA